MNRWWFAAIIAAVIAASLAPVAEAVADVGRAIPPGQEELLSQMLGRDATLPGDCRFVGGGVEASVVVARYTCGNHTVVIELRDAGDAPASAVHTQHFAIVVRSGPAPTGLREALATLVREGEAAVEWKEILVLQREAFGMRLGPLALAGCVGFILLVALVVQYIVARRHGAHQGPEPYLFASRGRITLASELFRRRQRLRDVRVVVMLILVATFLLTRMILLTRLPAYVDESVHIHWARDVFDLHMTAEFSVGRWLPIRIMALFLLLPIDPLLAARLGAVLMGLAVLLGCILINRELFSSTEGLLAGVIYTLLPFALLYDRMALVDIYLVAFATWALYFSILAGRRQGPAPLLALAVCIYGAILSKPTGGLFLVVPLLVSLLLVSRADRVAYLEGVCPTLVGGMTLLLFLLWAGYGSGLLASQVAFEGRGQLANVLIPNLVESRRWFAALLTPPVALLTVVAATGALVAGILGARADAFLVVLLAVSVLPFALVSRTWYPSYLLFAVVPISLLLARAITVSVLTVSRGTRKLSSRLVLPVRRVGYVIFTLLLLGATVPLDVTLVTHPEDAALPPVESSRYISGGLSGYGLPELSAFLRTQAQTRPLNVVRFDLVQPPKEGLDVYLSASDAIHLYTVDHRDERAAAQIASLVRTRRTFFVSNPENEDVMGVSARDYVGEALGVWSYIRPGSQTRLEVWEVQSEDLSP